MRNSEFEKRSFDAASMIHDTLCIKSKVIMNAKYLVAIDDDITSALMVGKLAKEMVLKGHDAPIILCVGGKGMMSFWTHRTTEAQNLSNVITEILPSRYYKEIVLLDKGRNTGANIKDIKKYILNDGDESDNTVVFCCTKRLSLRLKLTQVFQAPELDAFYDVDNSNLKEACQWYNYKKLHNNRIMYHELAALYTRCLEYEGKFQAPIPSEMINECLVSAALFLEKHYRIKLTRNPFSQLGEYVKILSDFYRNKKRIEVEQATIIREAKIDLR